MNATTFPSFKIVGFGTVMIRVQDSSYTYINSLHSAAKLGEVENVRQMLEKQPSLALQLNPDGFTPLHLACWRGNLDITTEFVKRDRRLCLVRDKYGRTPLHTASMKGRIQVMEHLLAVCPDSVAELTATRETPLHLAINHHQNKATRFLLLWIGRNPSYAHLINARECRGNTPLHLATSRKQLHIMQTLVSGGMAEVNALNAAGLTALDVFDILPPSRKIDMEIEKTLRRAGALRARDASKQTTTRTSNHEVLVEFGTQVQATTTTISPLKSKSTRQVASGVYNNVVLLIAAIFATITFHAGLSPPCEALEGDRVESDDSFEKQTSYITGSFLWFNSAAFLASVAMIVSLVHDLPLKPCLLVSVFSLFGAYICSIMTASPQAALIVLCIGSPILLLVAASGPVAFHTIGLECFKRMAHGLFIHGKRSSYCNM